MGKQVGFFRAPLLLAVFVCLTTAESPPQGSKREGKKSITFYTYIVIKFTPKRNEKKQNIFITEMLFEFPVVADAMQDIGYQCTNIKTSNLAFKVHHRDEKQTHKKVITTYNTSYVMHCHNAN